MELDNLNLPIDAPERRRLPPLLRRAWYGLNQAFRRRILHLRLTPDQFTVMRTLIEITGDGLTQHALAKTISSDPNTIASLLERMETNGWVERTKDRADRRARRIALLPEGREVYQVARSIAVELQSEVLAALPGENRELFLEQLRLLADACSQAAEASPRGRKRRKSGTAVDAIQDPAEGKAPRKVT